MTLHFGKVHSAHDIADWSAWLVIWRGGDSQANGQKKSPFRKEDSFDLTTFIWSKPGSGSDIKSLRRRGGKAQGYHCSLAGYALYGDCSVVKFHDEFDDGKTQS